MSAMVTPLQAPSDGPQVFAFTDAERRGWEVRAIRDPLLPERRARLAVHPHPPGPAAGAVRVHQECALGAQALDGGVGPAPGHGGEDPYHPDMALHGHVEDRLGRRQRTLRAPHAANSDLGPARRNGERAQARFRRTLQ